MGLLNEFQFEVKKAVTNYANNKFGEKELPKHRKTAVNNIQALCSNPQLDILILKRQIQQELAQLKTGWWFIKTGRSQLKREVQQVLENPRFSEAAFYHEIKQLLEIAQLRIQSFENGSKFTQLAARIEQLEEEKTKLEANLQRLQAQSRRIYQENRAYQHELSTINQNSPTDSLLEQYEKLSDASVKQGHTPNFFSPMHSLQNGADHFSNSPLGGSSPRL